MKELTQSPGSQYQDHPLKTLVLCRAKSSLLHTELHRCQGPWKQVTQKLAKNSGNYVAGKCEVSFQRNTFQFSDENFSEWAIATCEDCCRRNQKQMDSSTQKKRSLKESDLFTKRLVSSAQITNSKGKLLQWQGFLLEILLFKFKMPHRCSPEVFISIKKLWCALEKIR